MPFWQLDKGLAESKMSGQMLISAYWSCREVLAQPRIRFGSPIQGGIYAPVPPGNFTEIIYQAHDGL